MHVYFFSRENGYLGIRKSQEYLHDIWTFCTPHDYKWIAHFSFLQNEPLNQSNIQNWVHVQFMCICTLQTFFDMWKSYIWMTYYKQNLKRFNISKEKCIWSYKNTRKSNGSERRIYLTIVLSSLLVSCNPFWFPLITSSIYLRTKESW